MKSFYPLLIFACTIGAAQGANVSITYGAQGLSAINYNGFQYLSYGNFGVNGVNFVNAAGQVSPGSTSATTVFDTAHSKTTITFNWGQVTVAYAAAGSRLNLTITTANTSSLTVQGLFYEPFGLVFPSAPQEFDGVDPLIAINNGNPTAIRMTAGANAVVLCNDEVVRPLIVGFPWSLNKPANTIFPVKVETSQDSMLPNSIPFVNRPIAPGASDTYHLSLRFGPTAAATKTLAADVYQRFATAYPFSVNWTDRRPIGQLILGSTATGFPTNPRGWFNDPAVDVTTPAGIAAFQSRVLAWAQNSVQILKSMNAQGMVTWDIEGEQYPQPTTYIGDPTVFSTLAPEMAGVADQYFKTFTDAGLRVGICIRPQQLVIPPGGGAPTQTAVADPTQLLINKVAYANQRWGATLFYIDSNGDPNFPLSSSFFQTVAAQFPNVLLIPEHQTASYFGFGSWYGELRGGVSGTPQTVRDVYPGAFSVIYLPDGNFAQNQANLQAAVNRGDIMMFRAWYADPQNGEVLTLYPTGGVTPPAPGIVTPANRSAVSGTATVTASVAAGLAPVTGVQYLLDGAPLGTQVAAAPFSQALDTSGLAAGFHQLQAIAVDTLGDRGFAASSFFVAATGSPTGSGMISAAVSVPAGTQNLTDAGSLDWMHWGLSGGMAADRKANVAAQLSAAPIGNASVLTYANNPFAFSWSDGSSIGQEAGTGTGVFVVGAGNGFLVTAPADTSPRTLTIYTGVYRAQASAVFTLSDGSAPAYSDTSVVNFAGQLSAAYTVHYQAASAGQTLSAAVTELAGSGDPWSNVTLQAATLSGQ